MTTEGLAHHLIYIQGEYIKRLQNSLLKATLHDYIDKYPRDQNTYLLADVINKTRKEYDERVRDHSGGDNGAGR